MPDESSSLVSAIVTTHDSERTLEACLHSIRAQTYARIEVVVVDNHSTDASLDIAARYADRLATMGPERSAQRNHGASLAAGAYFLFIDSDMVLGEDVVADGVAALQRAGLPAAMIPELSFGEGFWTRCRALERSCYAGDDTVEAARLFTRGAFDEAGGYDLDLAYGGEDWDLSRRVARGRRLPRTRAVIRHDEGRVRLRTVHRKRRYYAPGYLRYLRKHGGGAVAQANPLLRTAYLRHWRRLARHPLLTGGVVVLKFVEVMAVLEVAAEQTLRSGPGRAAGKTRAQPPSRPLLITFGSVLRPDGGIQVRSRVLAENLAGLGAAPAIVSTREGAAALPPPPWARALHVPARRPRWGFSFELARLIRSAAADADLIIMANAMFMPAIALARVRLPLVWDTNECQTLHYSRLPRTPANRVKQMIWLGLERWTARRCRLAVAIGAAEADEWSRRHRSLRGKLVTVDHMAFASARSQAQSRRELGRLLGGAPEGPVLAFVGTMTAKHNAFAARWIIDVLAQSLPPTATVVLCGPGTERLRGRGRGARLTPLGQVDDVDSVIAAADLCLAPLASGAGVKTKMLHYLTHGRRVAATPLAAEGLSGAPGVFTASLEELPALVRQLIANPEPARIAQRRSAAQRAWVDAHHGAVHAAGQWRGVLQCLTPV